MAAAVAIGCAAGCWLTNDGPIEPVRCTAGPAPRELSLERAWPIDAPVLDFEPSGLALLNGRLLTVSDKHDDWVFELVQAETGANARPFRRVERPPGDRGSLDLEGIAVAPDGSVLLASEQRLAVLAVPPSGRARWVTPSLDAPGRQAGLFHVGGAGIEGIALLGEGTLLLAAEREPRGLIEVAPGSANQDFHPRIEVMPPARCAAPRRRPDDLTDLAVWKGQVFGLQRNAHLVVHLERTGTSWVEREAWSYARTENDPRLAYRHRKFGMGEGLAIDQGHVYVVLDNNDNGRESSRDDRRPLLFVFRNNLRLDGKDRPAER